METSVEPNTTSESSTSSALTLGLLGAVVVVGIVFAFSSSVLLANNWYSLFKAIHVTFALVWVGGGVLLATLALLAERKSDPDEITIVARQAAFVGERIFAPAGLIVFAMGIAMMVNTNFGWGKFWVIVGLVGYAATFATGLGVLSPLTKKISASAAEHGPTAPETMALIRRTLLVARFDVAVLLIVVLDMVTKPFA
ncbi:MAG TPA: DUF2269 family protein [Gaiellaceae bacterium]|nr:DUF2269 family protein [Gaiellaceae bacterium]